MGGKKHDKGKPQLGLIPVEFTVGVGQGLTYGAEKYGKHNFRDGIEFSRLLDAALRHLQLEVAGVKEDHESGLPHWAHAAASLAMYAYMKEQKPEMNDLHKYTEEELRRLMKMMYGETE